MELFRRHSTKKGLPGLFSRANSLALRAIPLARLKKQLLDRVSDQSGIALFMVIAAMTVLSVLVTEFTYVSQVNQRMAYDGLDQLKAHYLAKSGLKISLLRLKAYQQVKQFIGGGAGAGAAAAGAAAAMVPKSLLDKIWSFPFMYPIPTNIPGISAIQKEQIEEFQKNSSLEGSFSALIESESGKYNLNLLLPGFKPEPGPSPSPSPSPAAPPTPGATPTATPTFNPEEARKSLSDYLTATITRKFEEDPDFAEEYRDLRMEDLVENIIAWADRTFEKRNLSGTELIPPKRAPFYSLSELHMIQLMDDKLYDLFAPGLTVSATPGINVNTMKEPTLKAILPGITPEEVTEFFKFRDSTEEDNLFKKEDDFFKWIQAGVAAFRGDEGELRRYRDSLQKRGIRLVTDETVFKVTVMAQFNQATRVIEAWVTLLGDKQASNSNGPGAGRPAAAPGQPPPLSGPGMTPEAPALETSSGLRITFMRVL